MAENLPYLIAALICERVLHDKDGTLSAIRIVDRVQFEIPEFPPELQKMNLRTGAQLAGLVVVKSGPFKGKCALEMIIERPSGKRGVIFKHEFELLGGDHGTNVKLDFALGVEEEGLHWFDVNINGHLMTRIPLMLVRKERPQSEQAVVKT